MTLPSAGLRDAQRVGRDIDRDLSGRGTAAAVADRVREAVSALEAARRRIADRPVRLNRRGAVRRLGHAVDRERVAVGIAVVGANVDVDGLVTARACGIVDRRRAPVLRVEPSRALEHDALARRNRRVPLLAERDVVGAVRDEIAVRVVEDDAVVCGRDAVRALDPRSVVEGLDRPLVGRLVASERARDLDQNTRDAGRGRVELRQRLAVGTARRCSVVRAPVEAQIAVEVADEMRGDGGAARVRERVRLPERRASERNRPELLSDVDLERSELKPRRERVLGEQLDLPVDAVVREHPPSGARIEVRRVRRAERREAAGRVEDRVGAGDRTAPEGAKPIDPNPDCAIGDRRVAVFERADDRRASRAGWGRAPEGRRSGDERTRDRERRQQAGTDAA